MSEPFTLLADTSTALVLACFDQKGACVEHYYGEDKPAGDLAEVLDSLFTKHSLHYSDIESILVATGPGSFTGLRAGIAFIQGLSLPRNIPLYPFSSLVPPLLALDEIGKGGGAIFAKRGHYYATANVPDTPAYKAEIMVSTQELVQLAPSLPNLVLSGLAPDLQVLENAYPNVVSLRKAYPFERVYAFAKKIKPLRDGIIKVNYVQKPAAEAKRLGLRG